jgi:hypothetical protein
MGILEHISDIAGLRSLGGDALIEVLAGIVDGIGTGVEFTGEQLDTLGELFEKGADKIRAMQSGPETPAPAG